MLDLQIGSVWDVEHWSVGSARAGSYMGEFSRDHNVVTNEGLDALLNIMFHGTTQVGTWYVALFSDNYTPVSGDTYGTPGYTESTAYTEANRQAFTEATASGESITNTANKASFTMTTACTIYGGALVSNATKGDTAASAYLFGAAKFSSAKSCASGDVLKITVTVSVAST